MFKSVVYLLKQNERYMRTYIEIYEIKSGEIIKRLDLSNKTESQICKIEMGIDMKLSMEYNSRIIESEIELPTI